MRIRGPGVGTPTARRAGTTTRRTDTLRTSTTTHRWSSGPGKRLPTTRRSHVQSFTSERNRTDTGRDNPGGKVLRVIAADARPGRGVGGRTRRITAADGLPPGGRGPSAVGVAECGDASYEGTRAGRRDTPFGGGRIGAAPRHAARHHARTPTPARSPTSLGPAVPDGRRDLGGESRLRRHRYGGARGGSDRRRPPALRGRGWRGRRARGIAPARPGRTATWGRGRDPHGAGRSIRIFRRAAGTRVTAMRERRRSRAG